MKRLQLVFIAIFALSVISCGDGGTKKQSGDSSGPAIKELNVNSPDSDQYLLVKTNQGDFKIKLYRETPGHRKNFVNLVMNGFYDGQLFYRVKKDLLIQTGDYTSKTKPDAPDLGVTDVEYTVPSEIDPAKRYHKRGAIAAASFNKGDYSSGAHFYIVTGKAAKDNELELSERDINKELVNKKFHEIQIPYRQEIHRLNNSAKHDAKKQQELNRLVSRLMNEARAEVKKNEFSYSAAQRKEYKTTGGLPHLDAHYTVFGEVVEGMEIVDKISMVDATSKGRPRSHVVIEKITLLENGGK